MERSIGSSVCWLAIAEVVHLRDGMADCPRGGAHGLEQPYSIAACSVLEERWRHRYGECCSYVSRPGARTVSGRHEATASAYTREQPVWAEMTSRGGLVGAG